VAAVIEPLRAANRLLGRSHFSWCITTIYGMPAPTPAGIPIPAVAPFEPDSGRQPLFVLASYNVRRVLSKELIRWIGVAARFRPMIVGVEAGAWALAHAGLLNGRRATTHWEDLEAFGAAFPEVTVTPERFVIDGNRATTGGAGPALDMMLELIRRRLGYPLSLEVAKLFIYERSERVVQAPAETLSRPRQKHLARALDAMEAHIDEPLAMEAIARRAGVSARHLQTLFRAHLGISPHAHYLALRLNRARRLLIETSDPALAIAEATGFNSPAAFSRAYRVMHGETPSDTRRRSGP